MPIVIICGGIILTCVYPYLAIYLLDASSYGVNTILSYARIPIFFIGAIFGHWAKDGCNISLGRRSKYSYLCLLIIAIVSLYFCISFASVNIWACSLFFLPFIVITPIFCIVLAVVFDKSKKISGFLANIGKLSLELFLSHVCVFKLFDDLVNYIRGGIVTLILLVLTFLLAYLLYYINSRYLCKIALVL